MKTPTKRLHTCSFCKDDWGNAKTGFIFNEDLSKAIRMPDNTLKCYACQTEELQSRIVRVTPNSQRAREIMAEEQREVSRYNDYAQRLNRSAGQTLMKLKKGRYQ